MSIGNKIGLAVRQAANYAAYGLATVVDAGRLAGNVVGKQLVEAKLGLVNGIDTSKPTRRRKLN